MRKVIVTAFLALIFSSCDENRVYDYNIDFDDRAWLATDTPAFEFVIQDPLASYNVYGNVRNSVDFPYSRLFINYSLRDSSGSEIRTDLVSTYLFDHVTGAPKGSSGLGDIYDHRIPLLLNYRFDASGQYKMRFTQYMRADTLTGILAVGVRVEKVVSGN